MSNYSLRKAAISAGQYLRFIVFGTFSVRDDEVYVSVSDVAYLSFNLTIGFLVFYLSLTYGIERLANYSIIIAIGVCLTMVSSSLVTILSMLIVFSNRKRIWSVIVILDEVMVKFKKVNVYPNFRRHIMLFGIVACIGIGCIVLGLLWMAFYLGYSSKIEILISYAYLSTNFGASMGWSSMFHVAIYSRLKLMNETIR